ncbi:hypothetical protein EOL94_03100 [bacterium]|nr:hypothetical protein [bacterium]
MRQKFKKIFSISFYFLLLIILFQTRLTIWQNFFEGVYIEYLSFNLYFIDILIVILGLGLLTKKFKRIKFNGFLFWLLGAWELVIIFSIFYSLNWKVGLFHYFWFALFALLLCLIVFFKEKKEKIFFWFLFGSLIQSILAIWQFLLQKTFSSKYLGMAFHSADQLGQSVIEIDSGRWLRSYGSLDHPNILGAVMGLAVILSVYLLLSRFKEMKRDVKVYKIIFLVSVFVFCNFALLFSFSRLAIFSTYLSLFVVFMYFLFKKKYLKISLTLIFSFFLILFSFYNIFGFLINSRLNIDNRLEEKSLNERQEQYLEAQKIMGDNNFRGVGLGNYLLALREIKKNQNPYDLQPVHNSFILLRTELGLLGSLILFVYFVYLFFRTLINQNVLGFSLAIFLFIISVGEHWLFSLHFGWIFLALVSGFIFIESKKKNVLFSS